MTAAHDTDARSSTEVVNGSQEERLQALGISPGSPVTVVQQSGVTVFRVDQTELAVERSVADLILVEPE